MSQARLQPYGILCFAVPGIVLIAKQDVVSNQTHT